MTVMKLKKLSFVIGDDIESESDQLELTADDELHDEVMAYLQTWLIFSLIMS